VIRKYQQLLLRSHVLHRRRKGARGRYLSQRSRSYLQKGFGTRI